MARLGRRTALRAACLLLAAFWASPALAHPVALTTAPFLGGFFHSFTGLDHALAMVGVGVLSTRLARRATLLLPLTFLVFLAGGAGAGYLGVELGFVESSIALSCVALGGCILSPRLRRYRRCVFGLVAGFATFHGYAHSIELPTDLGAGQFTFGFLSASAAMHIIGVFVGEAFRGAQHTWLMLILASSMMVFGVLFLIRSFQVASPAFTVGSRPDSSLHPATKKKATPWARR